MAVNPINPNQLDPLNHNVPIVDKNGKATPYFLQQWDKARNINLIVDGNVVSIADANLQIQFLTQVMTQVSILLATLVLRNIIAGTGLSGGGSLASDVTLNIADIPDVAGSYDTATHTIAFTVNAQGQITEITATPI